MVEFECANFSVLILCMLLLLLLLLFTYAYFICEYYLVPILEKFSRYLKLPVSISGATFLAIGSSAPELLTSFSDVLLMKNNIGFGSIIGSSMFNNLVVVGMSLICVEQSVKLNIKTFTRDIITFIISVLLTSIMIYISDKMTVWSGIILLCFYVIYIWFIFYFNLDDKKSEIIDHEEFDLSINFIGLTMCIIVLSLISVVVVYVSSQIGCTLGIDPMILGILLVAIGTSFPDIFVSVNQAKKGNIDSAISNAIGSNIFDFFIGLGLPWFISNLFLDKPVYVNENEIFIQVSWAVVSSIMMLILLSISESTGHYKLIGYFFIFIYGSYVMFILY